MRLRVLVSMSGMVALGVAMALGAVPAVAQSDAPRTAWGQPDLGGVWDFRTITPMSRPESLGEQEFLTEDEAVARDQAAVDRNTRLWDKPAERTVAGGNVDRRGAGEAPGSYNQFWIDSGTRTISTRRTSLITDPPNGRYPPRTENGQRLADARRERREKALADSWLDFNPYDRCILGFNAGPPMTPSAYNNNMQLFQTPNYVAIVTEMVNTHRIVPLDGRPGLPPGFLQWSGDSRGHWEDDALVIETKNFDAKRQWRGTTGRMTLVERLTRVDADTLVYEFSVTDPDVWTQSWTAEVPMRRNELPVYEYACHEGHYSMPLMLAGRRAEERAAAEQQD